MEEMHCDRRIQACSDSAAFVPWMTLRISGE